MLLATGYERVRSIAAYPVGDIEALRRVELGLSETGVCSSNLPVAETADCGTSALAPPCCTPVRMMELAAG